MFLELTKSAALLLALGFMQGLVPRLWPKGGTWGLVVSGVIFGFIAVVAMMTPVQLQPGIIFDPRSVIISLAGFVGGPPVAVISAAIAGSYRLWLGGTGALTGTLVIAVCASMGIGYRYINHRYGIATKNWHLLLFGFVVHVAVVLCMFTLPPDIRWSAISRVTLPFLTVFPLITMFLGFFLQDIEDQLKIAKALEESEQRYKGVVEDTPVLICRFLPGGEITYVNDAYCRYFDKTAEALEGSNFLMLIPKEYWEIVMGNINSLTMDMPTQSHEHQVITPDGQHHWQRWVNRALFNQEGKITAYQSMGEDITGRKQAEASLIESEAKYRSIFQSTGVGMIVVIDGNGDIEEWNVGAERAFGYSSAEVAGKPLTMLMPERYREAHTKGFAWAREQGGLAHSGVTHQVHGLRKDGEEFSLELTLGSWKRDGDIFFSAIILDITKRKRAEEKVHTLSQAIEQSPVSVIITDPKANIVFVNNTFEQVTGYSSAEVIGQNPSILKSGKTSPGRYSDLWLAITNGKTWRGEFQNCRKNGEIFWEQAQIAPVLNESGATVHYLAVKEDISHRKQQEERILHQAHFDMLTGLPNRFLSLDRLSQQLNEAQRTNERVAVLFLDLDDFKKINDALGHEMGDKLLIEAARRLSSVVRSGDTVGRLGGDEFIVLLGGLTDAADASPVVENLLNRFRDAFSVDGRELILTASVGIAAYPDDGDTPSELLRNADSAMYYSKKQGRNTYSYFTNAMNFGVSQRLLLEEQLHGALDRGEFRLCYQPLVDVDGTGIIGVEALLRWNNPALGEVSPTEFIPIAEQTGLIVSLGEFVLTEALATVAEWQQKHQRQFMIAVNLSPRQFRDSNLVPFIEQTIQQTGIPGDSLELEITEGVLMSGHAYIDDALADLSDLGVGIAMDDFGTGYSSLSYLRSYPFNVLKIDRSFINDITVDSADLALVNAAIAMAHGLGLKVVAEGVETKEQLALLAAHGCDFAQGYLFSKPVSADEMTGILETESVG